MLKLYRKDNDRVTAYHEAWVSSGKVVEHWGELGLRGDQRKHRLDRKIDEDANITRVLESATASGFVPIDIEDHVVVVVEYAVTDDASADV